MQWEWGDAPLVEKKIIKEDVGGLHVAMDVDRISMRVHIGESFRGADSNVQALWQ